MPTELEARPRGRLKGAQAGRIAEREWAAQFEEGRKAKPVPLSALKFTQILERHGFEKAKAPAGLLEQKPELEAGLPTKGEVLVATGFILPEFHGRFKEQVKKLAGGEQNLHVRFRAHEAAPGFFARLIGTKPTRTGHVSISVRGAPEVLAHVREWLASRAISHREPARKEPA
jgi:hypothetical protein